MSAATFLNRDDPLGPLKLFGQARVGGFEFAVLRNQRADPNFGTAFFGRERVALALRALPLTGGQVRRVEALAAPVSSAAAAWSRIARLYSAV